jgi:hypothetical protein
MRYESSYLKKVLDRTTFFNKTISIIVRQVGGNPVDSIVLKENLLELLNNKILDKEIKDDIENDKIKLSFRAIIDQELNDFINDFSDNYQFSVLAGEHYFEYADQALKSIEIEFIELKKQLIKIFELFKKSGILSPIIFDKLWDDCISFTELFKGLNHFAQANLEINSKIKSYISDFEDIIKISSIEKTLNDSLDLENQRPLLINYGIFQINVLIESIDDQLQSDSKFVFQLMSLIRLLHSKQFKGTLASKILVEKCNYLIKKSKARLKGHDPEIDDAHLLADGSVKTQDKYNYYLCLEERTTQLIQILSKDLSDPSIPLSDFLSFKSDFGNKTTIKETLLKEKRIKCADIYELSELYIKLIEISIRENNIILANEIVGKIEALILYFKNNFDSLRKSRTIFENKSFETIHQFLNNQKLVILVKRSRLLFDILKNAKNSDIENLRDEVKKIKDPLMEYFYSIEKDQNDTIKNYFPYYQICKFYHQLISFLNEVFKTFEIDFGMIKKAIINYRKFYRILINNFEWCHEIGYLQVYLPYEESVCRNSIGNIPIIAFIDSSFLLPVNFKRIKKEIKTIDENFADDRAILINNLQNHKYTELAKKQDEVSNKLKSIEDLEKRVKDQLPQSVQILGLFTALITFAFGSIRAIPEFTCFSSIVIFMIGFAAAICAFALTIDILIKEKVNTFHKVFAIALGLLALVSMWFAWYRDCPINNSTNKEPSTKIENTISPQNSQWQQIIDTGKCCPPVLRKGPVRKIKSPEPCDTSKYILKPEYR